CYILLVTKNGQEYAEKEHEFLFMLISGVYYVVLLTILAVLQFKVGIRVPEFFRQNVFAVLLGSLLMFSPYYFIARSILKKLPPIPKKIHVTPEKFDKAKRTLLGVFMLGALLVVLLPWTLSLILL